MGATLSIEPGQCGQETKHALGWFFFLLLFFFFLLFFRSRQKMAIDHKRERKQPCEITVI